MTTLAPLATANKLSSDQEIELGEEGAAYKPQLSTVGHMSLSLATPHILRAI